MTTSVNLLVFDPAFSNARSPVHQYINTGDVAQLSSKSLSFFTTVFDGTDTRDPSTRTVNWSATTSPSIYFDDSVSPDFATALNGTDTGTLNALYALIDRVIFDHQTSDTQTALDQILTNDAVIGKIYVSSSLELSQDTATATVYLQNGNTVTLAVPTYAYVMVTIAVGTTPQTFGITLWASNSAFIASYPVSTIVAVVPPMDYATLLTGPLVTESANIFTVAAQAATLNYKTLYPQLDAVNESGYMTYPVTVYDSSGNSTQAIFNILYKGQEPSSLQVSEAIQAAVLASGTGSKTAWQARIPELFVVSRFYLIPVWDNTIARPDQVAFASIMNTVSIEAKVKKIFSSGTYLNQIPLVDVLVAPYNRMPVVSVPDINNPPGSSTLMQMYPDFQCYGSTDANFAYMRTATQKFSNDLTDALAVASGNTTASTQRMVTTNGMTFYVFTEGSTEFFVMTPQTYTAAITGGLSA